MLFSALIGDKAGGDARLTIDDEFYDSLNITKIQGAIVGQCDSVSSETNEKKMTFGLPVSLRTRSMFSRSKVPETVLEDVYFSPQSLVYSAFVVVFLVVLDPGNTSETLNTINFRGTRSQLTMFPLCTATPPETRWLPGAVDGNRSQRIFGLLHGLLLESERCLRNC